MSLRLDYKLTEFADFSNATRAFSIAPSCNSFNRADAFFLSLLLGGEKDGMPERAKGSPGLWEGFLERRERNSAFARARARAPYLGRISARGNRASAVTSRGPSYLRSS